MWEAGCQLSGTGTARKVHRETTALGAHHETREFDRTLSAGGSGPSCRTRRSSVAQQVFASTDAPRTKDGEVAMARRLAIRLYWMWRERQDYRQSRSFGSHAGQPGNRDGVH